MFFNLKVRLKQKWFWITLTPLVFLFIDQLVELVDAITIIATTGGALYNSDVMTLALAIIGLLFSILALIGFPVDLTTDGYDDSERVMGYTEPAPNAKDTLESGKED